MNKTLKQIAKRFSENKSVFIDLIALTISILALVISLNAYDISKRDIEITDPSSSFFLNNVYLDVTTRLSYMLFAQDVNDYSIVAEIYNTGSQPIIITGFSFEVEDSSLISSPDVDFYDYSPRKYLFLDSLAAREASLTNPIILEPTKRILIRSENLLHLRYISDFVNSFDREEMSIYAPDNKHFPGYPVSGWRSEDLFSGSTLNQYLTMKIGEKSLTLNFSFLNKKSLFKTKILLNGMVKEYRKRNEEQEEKKVNLEQLLIDEVSLSDISYILQRDSLADSENHSRENDEIINSSIGKILRLMGFNDDIYFYNSARLGFSIKKWNPRLKQEFINE